MLPVTLYGRPLRSVFELIGRDENSITYSIGWALANSPGLLAAISAAIDGCDGRFEEIRLQEFGSDRGYTDIELLGPLSHLIIEAKRGWWLPQDSQWARYTPRFAEERKEWRRFVAMSDCTRDYALLTLPQSFEGIPVSYFGWRDIEGLAAKVNGSHAEKRLGRELSSYLRTVATMQNPTSNMVYVVSLGGGIPEGCTISWIDIVNIRNRYFHPVGGGWPKEPPNYIAFRYGGQLQSIHHIDSYVVSTNLANEVPGVWDQTCEPHFVYTLGAAIVPSRPLRNGPKIVRNNRVRAMLDLLLTCNTLTEAVEATKTRLSG